jgi:serine/threonine protein kinase
VASIADRVLSALAYCHGAGVIHRDVKPSNILLGPNDEMRLIDFGLARDESLTALTHSREAFGTPDYSAPEQERGQDVDERADVYSMGQTIYYLLAGQVLKLRNGGYVSVRERRSRDLPDPPPRGIDAVLEQALAQDPQERFRSCEEMREALGRLVSVAPDLVQP